MVFLRRIFLSTAFAGLMSTVMSHAADLAIMPTPPESKMIDFMKRHGVDHFLMLNKQRGQILYVVNSKITDSDPALSGKQQGDKIGNSLGVTPSGIFKIEALDDSGSFAFKQVKGTNIYYTIHPVLDVKGQQREERLESMRPAWQRISSGCVNVSPSTIGGIRGFMTMPQTFQDDMSEKNIRGSFFVVLPEKQPVESIFKYPELIVR